ncbi:unnamed protein product [Adineta ricciae]|uniref:XLF-like N-terminal domain-containing protein n=1 Tax=Adineta ricciae TaxID=249248 RepID=A0A813P131_ADIRI|nr:unnamed protein product [Adineta ricciae]CAF1494815.1 unnamed protein product [Adineta ricciae]
MSFEDFAATCTRTFSQTPIRLVRMSTSLTAYGGSLDQPYRHLVLLCQPHFTSKTISIAFYLNGTAYFEYLNEKTIRQRLRLLNNARETSFHLDDLEAIITRLKTMLTMDGAKQDQNELHAKLLSASQLSVEINQNNLKFKFRCDERPELYEQHYVRQLLIQVKELSERQAYLCDLLEHKDQLPQFNAHLFLSTPMTLVDDQEEDDEEEEILSSSTTGRLWKSAFGFRGDAQFLDVCLLKKAYMKALEEMSDEEDENETVSSVLDTIVNRIEEQTNEDEDEDDLGLAQRLGKRALTTSIMSLQSDCPKTKRLRSNANISV